MRRSGRPAKGAGTASKKRRAKVTGAEIYAPIGPWGNRSNLPPPKLSEPKRRKLEARIRKRAEALRDAAQRSERVIELISNVRSAGGLDYNAKILEWAGYDPPESFWRGYVLRPRRLEEIVSDLAAFKLDPAEAPLPIERVPLRPIPDAVPPRNVTAVAAQVWRAFREAWAIRAKIFFRDDDGRWRPHPEQALRMLWEVPDWQEFLDPTLSAYFEKSQTAPTVAAAGEPPSADVLGEPALRQDPSPADAESSIPASVTAEMRTPLGEPEKPPPKKKRKPGPVDQNNVDKIFKYLEMWVFQHGPDRPRKLTKEFVLNEPTVKVTAPQATWEDRLAAWDKVPNEWRTRRKRGSADRSQRPE